MELPSQKTIVPKMEDFVRSIQFGRPCWYWDVWGVSGFVCVVAWYC
jgi:hypothetical protein